MHVQISLEGVVTQREDMSTSHEKTDYISVQQAIRRVDVPLE